MAINQEPQPFDDLDEIVALQQESDPEFDIAFRSQRLMISLIDERMRLGVSQARVAELIGVNRSVVSRMESKPGTVSLDRIMRYAAALGADVAMVPSERPSVDDHVASRGRPIGSNVLLRRERMEALSQLTEPEAVAMEAKTNASSDEVDVARAKAWHGGFESLCDINMVYVYVDGEFGKDNVPSVEGTGDACHAWRSTWHEERRLHNDQTACGAYRLWNVAIETAEERFIVPCQGGGNWHSKVDALLSALWTALADSYRAEVQLVLEKALNASKRVIHNVVGLQAPCVLYWSLPNGKTRDHDDLFSLIFNAWRSPSDWGRAIRDALIDGFAALANGTPGNLKPLALGSACALAAASPASQAFPTLSVWHGLSGEGAKCNASVTNKASVSQAGWLLRQGRNRDDSAGNCLNRLRGRPSAEKGRCPISDSHLDFIGVRCECELATNAAAMPSTEALHSCKTSRSVVQSLPGAPPQYQSQVAWPEPSPFVSDFGPTPLAHLRS